jgi:phospho-N-acetylmuramoyl-pentapeptide-transferase
VGADNAVNLTDGIDGLCASVTAVVTACFCVFFAQQGGSAAIFAAGLLGGLLGFLLFNHYPAKTFMGDTGSLFLGGAVCAMAYAYNLPLVLVPLGLVYIIETLSDIIQVLYFKATHGKRFFKMAPFHHHLELCGWSEVRIVTVATVLTGAMALLTLLGLRGFGA